MEDRNEEGGHVLYEYRDMDLQEIGKRSVKWDLNDWKWDGDLFVASQLNRETMGRQFFPLGNSSNSSSSCSDGGIGSHELMAEKKRRAVAIEEDNNNNGNLTLKLGDNNGGVKKTKLCGNASNHPVCQVENCEADLSKVKDYHRRHKVCQMHSKATSAIVGGIVQRFCQQCSRFHVLEEFDEGKRSCRRRLAGHNKRRRKTNPETVTNGNPSSDDHQSRNYALITLLKIISNMYSNQANHTGDQDLLSHVLKSLASLGGEQMEKNLIGHLQGRPQASMNAGNSALLAPQEDLKQVSVNVPEIPRQEVYVNGSNGTEKQVKINDFDLNDIYIDSDDGTDVERSSPPMNPATSSHDYPSWIPQDSHQSSPPQTSRNSDSASDQSPSSISGDAHSRTGRIEIKLFGKSPNDFPVVLRGEILDWLSHSPTDIESYIRPGCVILTIYLRQAEAAWEELCDDLGFSLRRLLDLSNDPLWTTGWIYVRVQNQMAFVFNGHVVVDTFLPLRSSDHSHIISVRPVAIATTTRKVQFTVKGINLHRSGTRLLCALEGKYLFQESTHEKDDHKENNEIECVNFSCEMPLTKGGRGFMEIEDQGLSSSFFPFIVVEDDVCSEIRVLESTLEFIGTDSAKQAMEFIYEIGWLLHRSKLKSRFGESYPNTDEFSLKRFKWLIEFSMDREWCAVIRHLLNIFFEGVVGSEEGSSIDATLTELCLLHRAVRKNSKPMVEMLLRYVPKQQRNSRNQNSLFRPDATGPAGLTPLHIAAGKDGSEDVLDALTEDPAMVGIEAWKISKDNTGFTPEDYARLRGHFSYIHLVQRKLNRKSSGEDHVVVSIPVLFTDVTTEDNEEKELKTGLVSSTMEITQSNCKLCDHKLTYRTRSRSLAYRPAMLSMVAIAAVCVCVALLFKSCPEVLYVFQPFRWELLDYGTS